MNISSDHHFRIYNSLTQSVEDFVPNAPGSIELYVCGLTVYDRVHVGHARAMVIFDAFVRYLRQRGWKVNYVRNFTDIDDKIIGRAIEEGKAPSDVAEENIRLFHEDVTRLGLERPSREPRATQAIDKIHSTIAKLVASGHAYLAEGSVWFSVASFPKYGKLSRQRVSTLRSDDTSSGKREPADFALWKASLPHEPSWSSPWGPGRPGWHIECSAMSCPHDDSKLDIHGGGLDLVFPHHENEIAQSEAANGGVYSRYWMHNGLLMALSGQKMGKSLRNTTNICELLDRYPAEAVRFYYLQNKYRSPLYWREDSLDQALALIARLYDAKQLAQNYAEHGNEDTGPEGEEVLRQADSFAERFLAALDDDFNTPVALACVFELVRTFNRYDRIHKNSSAVGRAVLAAYACVASCLNLLGDEVAVFNDDLTTRHLVRSGIVREVIDDRIAARSAARALGNWHEADRIRQELLDLGIEVSDTLKDSKWRVRLADAPSDL